MSNVALNSTNSQPLNTGATESTHNASTAAAGAHSNQVTGSTKIASLEDLKKKAPKVWKQMMLGIAMNVCHQSEKGQARIKEAMRKAREEAQKA